MWFLKALLDVGLLNPLLIQILDELVALHPVDERTDVSAVPEEGAARQVDGTSCRGRGGGQRDRMWGVCCFNVWWEGCGMKGKVECWQKRSQTSGMLNTTHYLFLPIQIQRTQHHHQLTLLGPLHSFWYINLSVLTEYEILCLFLCLVYAQLHQLMLPSTKGATPEIHHQNTQQLVIQFPSVDQADLIRTSEVRRWIFIIEPLQYLFLLLQ